ncbi:hypothetical protein B0H16DRAFT_1664528 [Mycena metata]|uniref:NAD(P)-binding domain-containing protein n=1 Tax=Mycena metata TaxID=1033252 RepID=A0AAD7IC67_9AGAR|nr:hypothetical protein B0H16DRAFT_1664528 [Mycena metata]
MAPLNILSIGASRNIGYFAAIRLLEQGATVTLLLRTPSVFDEDETIQKFVKSGTARLSKGDGRKEEDMRRAWEEAGTVDAVVFTVGAIPSFSITKGFVVDPNLVAQCMLCVLGTLPTYASAPPPRIIALSSTGIGPAAHKALPLLIKPLYSVLTIPHYDKAGMEQALAHVAGWPLDPNHGEPRVEILGENWTERLPAPGTLKDRVLVVRAALLTDGKCMGDEVKAKGTGKAPYRVSHDELGVYTISRKDTAHFVVDALARWDEFKGIVNLGY